MVRSSVALMGARIAASGLGFLGWLVAARMFDPVVVGLASAAVAAMMLCVQLALAGVGAAVIAAYPQHRHRPQRLVDTAAAVVAGFSILTVAGFLVLAALVLDELAIFVEQPLMALAFATMTVLGSLNTLYDHVSIALRSGQQVLVRNIAFGLMVIGITFVGAGAFGRLSAFPILLAWAGAGLAACIIAWAQLRRAVGGYRFRGKVERGMVAELVGRGVPNWLLSLVERLPALILPVLVAEVLSPELNAYWYSVWMMAWAAMIIPVSMGQSLFAEAAHRPHAIAGAAARSLKVSLGIGIAAAGVLVVLAEPLLGILGAQYAAAGQDALRVLAVTVIPGALIQAYYGLARARHALGEAIGAGALAGVGGTVLAIGAGMAGGLVAMAAAWLAVQLVLGSWAAARLVVMIRSSRTEWPASSGR